MSIIAMTGTGLIRIAALETSMKITVGHDDNGQRHEHYERDVAIYMPRCDLVAAVINSTGNLRLLHVESLRANSHPVSEDGQAARTHHRSVPCCKRALNPSCTPDKRQQRAPCATWWRCASRRYGASGS